MKLSSSAPHDFLLTLDVRDYFWREHEPERIYDTGYARPLNLSTRDVLAIIRFNDNPEEPAFDVEFSDPLDEEEVPEAEKQLTRILGLGLPMQELMAQAADDPLIGPMLTEYYGFRRIAGANVFEDAFRDIIKTRISHKPTARRMDQDIRRTFGSAHEYGGTTYYAYPRFERLAAVDPDEFREFGVSRRKAEYIIGMASSVHDGGLDLDALDAMAPEAFYDAIQKVRGIGPATAQTLMLNRPRPDAVFPSHYVKDQEKGLRRWIIMSYGLDPQSTSDDHFASLIERWSGYEALAIELLYYNWVLSQLERG